MTDGDLRPAQRPTPARHKLSRTVPAKNKGRGIEPKMSCHVRPERASYGHGVSLMAMFAGHEYDREEAIQLGTSGVSRYRRHAHDGDGIKLCQISIPQYGFSARMGPCQGYLISEEAGDM